jgi:hypothetical protein
MLQAVEYMWLEACRQEGVTVDLRERQKELLKIVRFLAELYMH